MAFDINKISDKQRKELESKGSFTDRFNRQRSSDGSVVGASKNSIDLSNVVAGKGAIPEQPIPSPAEFVPQQFQQVPQAPAAPTDPFEAERQSLTQEISTLEQQMANRGQRENQVFEDTGVFDQMQQLNASKARLAQLEDQAVEIQVTGKQELRGRGATFTDFRNLTGQPLEDNALSTLAQSRLVNAQANALETNVAIITDKLEAENAQADFVYAQKTKRLDTIVQAQADIITAKEERALEERKNEFTLELERTKFTNGFKQDLAIKLAESGVSGQKLGTAIQGTIPDMLRLYDDVSREVSLADQLTLLKIDEQKLKNSALELEFTEEADAELTKRRTAKSEAQKMADNIISNMIENDGGLQRSAGTSTGVPVLNLLGAIPFVGDGIDNKVNSLDKNAQAFQKEAVHILNTLTITDGITKLKELTGAVGQTTEREWPRLEQFATDLAALAEKEDEVFTGRFSNKNEELVRESIKGIAVSQMKISIAQDMSTSEYYDKVDQVDDYATIKAIYDKQKASSTEQLDAVEWLGPIEESINPTSTGFIDTALNKTMSLIQEEEGFRSEAYLDQAGVPTIGFGTTVINGRPVQLGDTLSKPEANAIMAAQVVDKYTNWIPLVTAPLSPAMFAGLTSFEYNLGGGIWEKGAKLIIDALNRGDEQAAAEEMLKYNKARDPQTGELRELAGLTNRRRREADLITT